MEIRLKETELKSAVKLWIENEGFSLENKTVTIDFTAGRGTNGFSAEVDVNNIVSPDDTAEEAVQVDLPEEEETPESEEAPWEDDESDEKVTGEQPALDLDLD